MNYSLCVGYKIVQRSVNDNVMYLRWSVVKTSTISCTIERVTFKDQWKCKDSEKRNDIFFQFFNYVDVDKDFGNVYRNMKRDRMETSFLKRINLLKLLLFILNKENQIAPRIKTFY